MILGPYGGPGGWAEAMRMLGLAEVGVELDPAPCATRTAAGHQTIRADVATFPLDHLTGQVEGLTLSPPCTTFSAAGKGEGRVQLARLVAAVHAGAWDAVDPTRAAGYGHVLEVGRWVETLRPAWVACEQVPEVLPVWRAYAERWRAQGWSAWAGVLCAADYGVPQERYRAFLIARRVGGRAAPPAPTHAEHPDTLFGVMPRWVTMASALGWRRPGPWVLNRRQQTDGVPVRLIPLDEPAPTLTGVAGAKGQWVWERPATTIVGDGRVFGPHSGSAGEPQSSNSIPITLAEALILQGFDPDYPAQGNKGQQHQQVGNACPPPLAAHVIAAATGRNLELEETAA